MNNKMEQINQKWTRMVVDEKIYADYKIHNLIR